jgi:heme-degrading monooxygenase HmoA
MNYFVLPGKEQIFEDACDRVVKTMQGIDGHDESHLYRRIGGDQQQVYLIVSRWESEDAFDAFVASDAFKKVTTGAAEHPRGPAAHTTLAKR